MHNATSTWTFTIETTTRADVVFDVLTDLRSHVVWGGDRQARDFRLDRVDGPFGPLTEGDVFHSVGRVPMTTHRFEDESVVIRAERPGVFEFVTTARMEKAFSTMVAEFRHRYFVDVTDDGCRVTYQVVQGRVDKPLLRAVVPGVAHFTRRVMIPMYARRGLRNLVDLTEEMSLAA